MSPIWLASLPVAAALGTNLGIMLTGSIQASGSRAERPPTVGSGPDRQEILR
jgi:hypothetical protein